MCAFTISKRTVAFFLLAYEVLIIIDINPWQEVVGNKNTSQHNLLHLSTEFMVVLLNKLRKTFTFTSISRFFYKDLEAWDHI